MDKLCSIDVPYSTQYAFSNDLLTYSDAGLIFILVLLNLSAAFDTIDHHILLQRMEHQFGIRRSALNWFKSCLSDIYNCVHVTDESSTYDKVIHGVPQGSVRGPSLFTLYMLPSGKFI